MNFCLDRESSFSFACGVCGRCCSGKIIMAGPHEILGMSRLLGIDTTQFLSLYTGNGGTTLRSVDNGCCVFLTVSGCRVHAERPLVCRLYPLGRTTDERGEERFAVFPKEPECKSVADKEGTIQAFLESQGVEPYLEWARFYGRLYRRMIGLLDQIMAGEEPGSPAVDTASGAISAEPGDGLKPAHLSSWQDIDATLAEYCAEKGIRAPEGIKESIALHIRAIEEWLDDLESRLGGEGVEGHVHI